MTLSSPVKHSSRLDQRGSDTKSTCAVGRQSAAWYDQVAGCGGPKPTTMTCWCGDGQAQFSQVRWSHAVLTLVYSCSHSKLNPFSNIQPVKVVMQCQPAFVLAAVDYDMGCCIEDTLKLVCDWTPWPDEQTAAVVHVAWDRSTDQCRYRFRDLTTHRPNGVDAAGKNTGRWVLSHSGQTTNEIYLKTQNIGCWQF